MRDVLSDQEMRGSLRFDFHIGTMSDSEAQRLCAEVGRVVGVQTVSRSHAPLRGRSDTFTVTVENSRLQYFTHIYHDVMAVAKRHQDSLQ